MRIVKIILDVHIIFLAQMDMTIVSNLEKKILVLFR